MSVSTTPDEGAVPSVGAERPTRAGAASGPVVIEVRDLDKRFRIPENRIDTLKERVTHPLRQPKYRDLRALRGVSFDVHSGEFFGIVGRNGSGKSTLLKILASIYRADAGRVRMAGRMAPFIELGVGFNPELTARENVALNGVLFGLSRREAANRLDAVLDFAELREFVDLKIKNYSSGMMVRLAFSIMVQADADILLVDEVLAVGDASFAGKCMDVFYERRNAGRTVVLVTHDMATVQSLCHRAMLLHDGQVEYVGDPEDAALRYYRLNFGNDGIEDALPTDRADEPHAVEINVRAVEAHLRGELGEPVVNVEQGAPIVLDAVVEAAQDLEQPAFLINVVNAEHVIVAGFLRTLEEPVVAGQRVRLAGEIENRLVPGRYYIDIWIRRSRRSGEIALQCERLVQFRVYGTRDQQGVVYLQSGIEAVLEPGPVT